MIKTASTAAVILASFLATACGGSSSPSMTAGQAQSTANQVVSTSPSCSGASAPIALSGAQTIKTYVDAGDTVATNPDSTVGVKLVGAGPECINEVQDHLR